MTLVDLDQRLRLLHVDIFEYDADRTLVQTPQGKAFLVDARPTTLAPMLRLLDGTRSLREIVTEHPATAAFLPFFEALSDEHVLVGTAAYPGENDWSRMAPITSASRPNPREIDLIVVGDEHLVGLLLTHDIAGEFRSAAAVDHAKLSEMDVDRAVILHVSDHFAAADIRRTQTVCRERHASWTHFHLENGVGWFGPHVTPQTRPDFDDLRARRTAAAKDARLIEALSHPVSAPYLPPAAELSWLLGTFLIDAHRWAAGFMSAGHWHEVELNPIDFTIRRHPVLPLPGPDGHPPQHPPIGTARELLVDERTGLVTLVRKVRHHPSIPSTLTTFRAKVADVSRVSPWRTDPVAGGSTFRDDESAASAAIGEAVERYCGNIVQPSLLTWGDYRGLRGAVDPQNLVLFSDRQYATRGFPFRPFDRDLEVHWVRGRSLTRDEPAWLPASLVYPNWHRNEYARDPKTNSTYYPGLAAGPDLQSAITAGLQELIERHATMIWWLNRPVARMIEPSEYLTALWSDGPRADDLQHWLLDLPNEFGVPVVAGVVEHADDALFTIGFAARATVTAAAAKAWAEALTLQDLCRDLQNADGAFRKAAARAEVNGSYLKPWRADRCYLDDYRSDFRDVVDLTCQAQVHLDPRAHDIVRPWTRSSETATVSDIPDLPGEDLGALRSAVENRGLDVLYADITTPDVAAAGLTVVRVIVPGLVPNFPAAFPYLGLGVVQNAAVELGWRSAPLPESELNYFPLPHA